MMIPNSEKNTPRKENYRSIIADEYTCRNSQQNARKWNSAAHWMDPLPR